MGTHARKMQFTLRQLFAVMVVLAMLLSLARIVGGGTVVLGLATAAVVTLMLYLMTTPAILLMPPDMRENGIESPGVHRYSSLRRILAVLIGLLAGSVVTFSLYARGSGLH